MSRHGEHRIDIYAEKVAAGIAGVASPGGFWQDILSLSVAGVLNADLAPFPAGFKRFRVLLDNCRPVNNDRGFRMSFSDDGGLTFLADGDYRYTVKGIDTSAAEEIQSASNVNFMSLTEFTSLNRGVGNVATEGVSGIIYFTGASDVAQRLRHFGQVEYTSAANTDWICQVGGSRQVAEVINGVRFFWETGNHAEGDFLLQGAKT